VIVGGIGVTAGGLVGYNDAPISYVYAMGSVTGDDTATAGAAFGSLVGGNAGNITQAYAVGDVSGTGAGAVGGLIGANPGTISAGYWDTQTTGQSKSADGVGRTTAQLQADLQAGFSSADWTIVADKSFPYLKWQVRSGAPQIVSGTISGEKSDAGVDVLLRVNGKLVTALVTMSSGANGYYYELLALGSISHSGSDVLAYLTEGKPANNAYNSAKGSLTGFNLAANTLKIEGSAASETVLLSAIEKALGANSSDTLYTHNGQFTSGIDLNLDLSAVSFKIDHAINVGMGTLKIDAAGTVSQNNADAITAKMLTGHSVQAAAFASSTNVITDLGVLHPAAPSS
jgi:hypothetical protein